MAAEVKLQDIALGKNYNREFWPLQKVWRDKL